VNRVKSSRNAEVVSRYEAGETGTKLARRFGITHARVYQILNRHYLGVKK